ncbi:hypothetical protein [Nocardioides sp. B-3]|uniref:hypothetical protein n=1 Tax=Nocardioides sp. B-3 TaxID=2895565 RepID=UPI0021520CF4|nr:hypothetical protein [Nocardioides sp. B-3]UUZ61041.1 hypothetical protein LP418_10465 [Nocardioides sp. B-3]
MSHNPFSDLQSNGKTLSAFFQSWPQDRPAQLYFTLDEPAFTVCSRFYRVTDLDMLKATLGRTGSAGPVLPTSVAFDAAGKQRLHTNPLYRLARRVLQQRWPAALMVRSWFWRGRRWETPQLERWLDEVDPDIIFFQSSNCTFAFDVVERICERRNLPLILETTDDYLTPLHALDPIERIQQRRISGAYQRAVTRSAAVIAIGDRMAEEYAHRFGGDYAVAMNSVESLAEKLLEVATEPPFVLHFAGNPGLNRWRVLAAIGAALDTLADEHGIDTRLEIFSLVEPEASVLTELTSSPRVTFLGQADAEELAKRRSVAALLVHVESFDRKNQHITRLSVSTKIPEYLSSGRCVLAVGPAAVASIGYPVDNEAAAVATSPEVTDIAATIRQVLADPTKQRAYATRGPELVKRNHLRPVIAEMVQERVVAAVAEW